MDDFKSITTDQELYIFIFDTLCKEYLKDFLIDEIKWGFSDIKDDKSTIFIDVIIEINKSKYENLNVYKNEKFTLELDYNRETKKLWLFRMGPPSKDNVKEAIKNLITQSIKDWNKNYEITNMYKQVLNDLQCKYKDVK